MGDFGEQYRELERCFQRQVVEDRAIENLREVQHIWVPMTFLPAMPAAAGEVEAVFIGMYPSQNWLREKDPRKKLTEASKKVDSGFRISLSTILDLVFHLAVREFLLRDGEKYYVTDISKGAMEKEDEEIGRADRWPRWYPWLKLEIELVVGDGRAANTRIIPIGSTVEKFLGQMKSNDSPESGELGRLTSRITHWGDRRYQNSLPRANNVFFGRYGDRIRRLAAELLDELDAASWWRNHVEENMEKAFVNQRQEWQCQWLFDRYRDEFRLISGLGSGSHPWAGLDVQPAGLDWEDRVMRVVKRHGLTYDDKRPRDGCFWVFGGEHLGSELRPLGFEFVPRKEAWWRR